MTHLTPDELIDAMEADADESKMEADADQRKIAEHLAACHDCRRQLADLQSVLGEARQVSVPEPSPMFWPHFSRGVSAAIESAPGGAWPAWLRWQLLLPLGAVATIVLALMIATPKEAPDAPVALVAPDAPVAPATTDSWETVATIVGQLDVETASAAGVIEPGVAEQAVLELNVEERQELTRLLKDELTRAKS